MGNNILCNSRKRTTKLFTEHYMLEQPSNACLWYIKQQITKVGKQMKVT